MRQVISLGIHNINTEVGGVVEGEYGNDFPRLIESDIQRNIGVASAKLSERWLYIAASV